MSKNQNLYMSEFYCTKCGKKGLPIQRKKGKARESGHLKKIFCLTCQEEVNHAEVNSLSSYSYEDFRKEFKLGRFINGNRLPIAELSECSNTDCQYNINGRCWNSNFSFDCGHRIKKEI